MCSHNVSQLEYLYISWRKAIVSKLVLVFLGDMSARSGFNVVRFKYGFTAYHRYQIWPVIEPSRSKHTIPTSRVIPFCDIFPYFSHITEAVQGAKADDWRAPLPCHLQASTRAGRKDHRPPLMVLNPQIFGLVAGFVIGHWKT